MAYDPHAIEPLMQKLWDEAGVASCREEEGRKKYYCLEMFMYPSGKIHMGHVRNYTLGDVIARFRRQRGENVLHPMGFDAFGLPAENAAIQGGSHPKIWTDANIHYMQVQLKRLGFLYDWKRQVLTCDPDYYRWNQWFFLRLMEKGLVYRAKRCVNWCNDCGTVLANEQVEDGACWRCSNPVVPREVDQWFFKIGDYARELLDGLDDLTEWPEKVVTMQRNWIGYSEGARLKFPVKGGGGSIEVYTTRIDTIYGATFVVLAPEHPMAETLITDGQREEAQAFLARVRKLSTYERTVSKEKDGVFTGSYAMNPFSGEEVPIYLANFVLMDYGTGAIMSVPAHDQRDFEFAKQYGIPIRVVVQSGGLDVDTMEEACSEDGAMVNSGPFDGLPNREAIESMAAYAQEKGSGEKTENFRLRDWGISRQRYWGTPIPVIYCDTCGVVPVPVEDLPVVLPPDVTLTGSGESPLATHPDFVDVPCPKCGKPGRRETDTLDTFVDSSWYFLRYCDNRIDSAPINKEAVNYWCPVDFYIGGIEHATMHLIYFRFFTKALRDMGLLDFDEPVKKLLCQGMVIKDGAKMSKSIGNIVDPDAMIGKYGADAVRLNIIFASPPEKDLEWKDEGAEGGYRFLCRVEALVEETLGEWRKPTEPPSERPAVDLRRKTHQTIRKATEELGDRLHFNTAIAGLMELTNAIQAFLCKYDGTPQERFALLESVKSLVQMLAPFAPHLADHLWQAIGRKGFLVQGPWPEYDPEIAREEEITLAVQVNGKLRGQISVPLDTGKDEILAIAREEPKVRSQLEGRTLIREIVVPGRIVNFVVK